MKNEPEIIKLLKEEEVKGRRGRNLLKLKHPLKQSKIISDKENNIFENESERKLSSEISKDAKKLGNININFSLSLKLTLIVLSVSAVIIVSLTFINIQEQTSFFEKAYSDKAVALAQALDANIGTNQSELNNEHDLQTRIYAFINNNPDVLKININAPDQEDGELKVIASSDLNSIGNPSSSYNDLSFKESEIVKIPTYKDDSHSLTVITPLHLQGRVAGTYEMTLSMNSAYADLGIRVRNLITVSAISIFLLVISFLYLLRRIIVKPIMTFRDAAKMIGKGDLNTQINVSSRDELGDLASAFNNMTADLKQSRVEIERYSKTLEKQVYERTKELEKSKEELRAKVEALEENKTAMLNIMLDLKKTITDLEEAKKQIDKQNMELKSAQDELFSLNKDLELKVKERTADVERILKQKDEFIGQLGHDLKNPLTPLVGLLPMLEEREKDPKVKEHLGVIIRNVEYMRDLVIKTLQLARLNSPLTKFEIQDTNLLEGINNVIENQQLFLKENNIAVENKINEDIFVKADKLRLEELISNLLTNAIKFTVNEKGKIVVDARKNGGIVTISIKDAGIGMTEDQLGRIFDEFYKADESRHEMDSSGLGLTICKRIIERHGGRIWAESSGKGKGSTFYFTLNSGDEKDKE